MKIFDHHEGLRDRCLGCGCWTSTTRKIEFTYSPNP